MQLRKDVILATSEFWYDVFEGGYINPADFLANDSDVKSVEDAIKVLTEFSNSLEPIMEEM